MSEERGLRPELARPYFTRQAQYGRRVVFAWRPADVSPHNPLTTSWPNADELTEGIEFADEEAARRFDLDRAVGASGRPPGGRRRRGAVGGVLLVGGGGALA